MTFGEAAILMMGGGGPEAVIKPLDIPEITENGTYQYLAEEYDWDGFDPVRFKINVPDRYDEGFRDGYNYAIRLINGTLPPETLPIDPTGGLPEGSIYFPNGIIPSPNTGNPADWINGGLYDYANYPEMGAMPVSVTNPTTGWGLEMILNGPSSYPGMHRTEISLSNVQYRDGSGQNSETLIVYDGYGTVVGYNYDPSTYTFRLAVKGASDRYPERIEYRSSTVTKQYLREYLDGITENAYAAQGIPTFTPIS